MFSTDHNRMSRVPRKTLPAIATEASNDGDEGSEREGSENEETKVLSEESEPDYSPPTSPKLADMVGSQREAPAEDVLQAPPEEDNDDNEEDPSTAATRDDFSVRDIAKYVKSKSELISVKKLAWDKHRKQGQIRTLNENLVEKYFKHLKAEEFKNVPRKCVQIIVKEKGGLCR